jgi:hypothetical protein
MSVTGTVREGLLALPDGGIAIVEANVGAALLIPLAGAALATPLGLLDAVGWSTFGRCYSRRSRRNIGRYRSRSCARTIIGCTVAAVGTKVGTLVGVGVSSAPKSGDVTKIVWNVVDNSLSTIFKNRQCCIVFAQSLC